MRGAEKWLSAPPILKVVETLARKVAEDTAVAFIGEKPGKEWPGEISWDGPGYYVVESENSDDHQNANFGKKVVWEKNKPDKEDNIDHENNEGHFVYSSGSDE